MDFLIKWILFIGIIIMALSILIYIFQGLSFYKACKIENIEHKWLAWVPTLNAYNLLKLGEKNIKYIWVFIANIILGIILNFLENSILAIPIAILIFVIAIFEIVISIQAYIKIANKYNMSSAWFIVGIFIFPVMLIAYIILHSRVNKILTNCAKFSHF